MAYEFITEPSDISKVVRGINSHDIFALDIETTGLNPHDSRILLCQIGFRDGIFVLDADKVKLDFLVPYINSWKWKKVIHNIKFESQFFEHFFGAQIGNAFDTLTADQIVEPTAFHNSLESVALRYLNVKLNKKTRESFFKLGAHGNYTKSQLDYAVQDVEILFPIMDIQVARLAEMGQEKVAEMEFALSRVVGHMELIGIPVDVPKWKAILNEYQELHETSRVKMNELIFADGKMDEQLGLFSRDGINLNSQPQVLKALNSAGVEVTATNERVIALIDHPLTNELLEYRGLQKAISAYGETFLGAIHPFTNRIHPSFQQMGADTGRFSCREPNVQQIPKKFRSCIGNLKDFVIIGGDYSQIELRIIAELSEDPRMLQAFISGMDIHSSTASLMFNKPVDQVSKEERFMAKTINFGLAYGMGVGKFKDTVRKDTGVDMDWKKANSLVERHKATYRKAAQWLAQTGSRAYEEGFSQTMFGRKRFYTKPTREGLTEKEYTGRVEAIKRKGANTPIQGTNADMTKLAMINLHNDLITYKMRADIINQVHDEIVLLAHKSQAESVKELVEESMLTSAQSLLHKVPVRVDTYISDVWEK